MLPIQSEAGWTSETVRTVWEREKYFSHFRIRTPNHPARSLFIIPTEPSARYCTVMRRITTFRSTTDRVYDSGSEGL